MDKNNATIGERIIARLMTIIISQSFPSTLFSEYKFTRLYISSFFLYEHT